MLSNKARRSFRVGGYLGKKGEDRFMYDCRRLHVPALTMHSRELFLKKNNSRTKTVYNSKSKTIQPYRQRLACRGNYYSIYASSNCLQEMVNIGEQGVVCTFLASVQGQHLLRILNFCSSVRRYHSLNKKPM